MTKSMITVSCLGIGNFGNKHFVLNHLIITQFVKTIPFLLIRPNVSKHIAYECA